MKHNHEFGSSLVCFYCDEVVEKCAGECQAKKAFVDMANNIKHRNWLFLPTGVQVVALDAIRQKMVSEMADPHPNDPVARTNTRFRRPKWSEF